MPAKGPTLSGGIFRSPRRRAEQDEEDATNLANGTQAQLVDDPRSGAVFLSLVNRLSALEAAVRGARLAQLSSEESRDLLVVEGEEATGEILALNAEVQELTAEVQRIKSSPVVQAAKRLNDLFSAGTTGLPLAQALTGLQKAFAETTIFF